MVSLFYLWPLRNGTVGSDKILFFAMLVKKKIKAFLSELRLKVKETERERERDLVIYNIMMMKK